MFRKDITALTRPASISKPANVALKAKGIDVRPLDTTAPQETIVSALKGLDIVISAVGFLDQLDQIPLVTAAKEAGVKRFVPCAFITVMPVGVHPLRDVKEEVYNHIKRLRLPYTIIDVGWWYQISFPRLPSGKIDFVLAFEQHVIPGDGNVPSGLTDLRDIGRYVARIIVDERTLNKMVSVYNEVWTPNQVYDRLERLSGETIPRSYTSLADLETQVAKAEAEIQAGAQDFATLAKKNQYQYFISWGVRGDNTPEMAEYLGYLDGKALYPDFTFITFEAYLKEVLEGKAKGIYEELKKTLSGAS